MTADAPSGKSVYGLMSLGDVTLGIDIRDLSEVCLVPSLEPLLTGNPGVLGAINLRGGMIPVLDPLRLCGMAGADRPPAAAAILTRDRRSVALGVEAITGLAEVAEEDLQTLFPTGAATAVGGFYDGAKPVATIDVAAIFARADLPIAVAQRRGRTLSAVATGQARSYLTFEAGGAVFALEAETVDGTVPRQEIDANSLASGPCLGSIHHHGRRIPVMDANAVLGLGRRDGRRVAEIVVMRYPGNRVLGLAVDVISRIQSIPKSELKPPAALLQRVCPFVTATAGDGGGRQIYVLDQQRLSEDAQLVAMSEFSDPAKGGPVARGIATAEPGTTEPTLAEGVVKERVRHLTFVAGAEYASPITQIVRILEPPAEVTPIAAPGPVDGFFDVDGRVTPLVDLDRAFGAGDDAPGRNRILLVGPPDAQVGFRVARVTGIEASTWRAPAPADDPVRGGLVHLAGQQGARVLPRLDLERLAGSLGATAAA